MTINFHDPKNKHSYATREADTSWMAFFGSLLKKDYQHAVDIGCGGGIYSKALAEMGIPAITGVDFSKVMIEAAKMNCKTYRQINFTVGNAYDTGLTGGMYDLVFERALIHHLNDLSACFSEAFRLLKQNGTIFIQDRTPSDCLLKGTNNHIRGYFFDLFPDLKEIELNRRHTGSTVIQALTVEGFTEIKEIKRWEIRKKHASKKNLLTDIRTKSGRSILHELTDQQLDQLIDFIDRLIPDTNEIIEKDRWTIWMARKV